MLRFWGAGAAKPHQPANRTRAILNVSQAQGVLAASCSGRFRLAIGSLLLLLLHSAGIQAQSITGTVFEDVNYGGGAGRNLAGSGGVARPGATVELYNATGNYITSTTTNASGVYNFPGLAAGNYTVRVVNSTVTSSRTGATAALIPVQTYNGTTTRVGGEAPAKTDVGAAAPSNGIGTGPALLRFEGGTANGDNTAFVDLVEVLNSGGNVVTGAANNSFETPDLGNAGASFSYGPTGVSPTNASWTFNARSGIAATGSNFNVPASPLTGQGDQVALLQTLSNAQPTLEQGITLPAGTYTIRFRASQRNGNNTANQTVRVLVNGIQVLASFAPSAPVAGLGFTQYTTGAFTISPTLASLVTTTAAPQSIQAVTVTGTAPTTADFGYNFDTVVNTNNTGQGSLRQFIANANALGDENLLAQSGSNSAGALVAGKETSIFMIPSGAAVAGQRAGLPSGLTTSTANGITSNVANINITTVLPNITGANTSIDGTTQTFNIGNTNNVPLGTGGTVGTSSTALAQFNGPEVQVKGVNNINGITIADNTNNTNNTNNTTVRGLSIYGFNTSIFGGVNSTGTRIEQNVIGASAVSFTDPGAGIRTQNEGINLNDSDNGFVTNNLIGFNGSMGIWVLTNGNGSNGNSITGNEIRGNGLLRNAGNGERLVFDGIELQGASTNNTVSGNLITANLGHGIDTFGNTIGGNTITGNTISNNGVGVATNTGEEGSGLRVFGATNTTTIANNVLTGNNGSGVLLLGTANRVTISQNAMSGNTRLGIDLLTTGETNLGSTAPGTPFWNGNTGTTPNVTLNDNGEAATGGNGLLNFPVITSSTLVGTNLVVTGYARPGSLIELFLATPLTTDPTNTNKGFGQGSAYLGSFTEGLAGTDTNSGTGSYGVGGATVNGLNQGTDNTNLFTFTIPLTGIAVGTVLTSTATLGNSTSEFSGNAPVKFAPVPAYVTNPAISSTAGPTTLSALSATDADGTVANYTITSVPAGSAGTLFYNTNADGVSGTYQLVTVPLTLTPAQAGSLRFDPTGASAGNVTFTYTATDNEGNTSTTATNGGTPVQGPAVFTIPLSSGGISASNDSNTVPLNTAKTGNVLLNDYNPDNTGLAVALAGTATAGGTTTTYSGGTATTAHGTVTVDASGAYTYTPNAGYIGSDAFAYQVCSTSGTITCVTALVTLRVYDPGTACTSGTGPNLLANADFNQGNTGFVTDYTFVTKPNPLVMNGNGLYPTFNYAVDANATDYHLAFFARGNSSATNPNDQFLMLNGAPSVARIYSQTVAVQPNRYYTFSAFLNNLLDPTRNTGKPEIGFVINGESTSGTRLINESPDRWIEVSDIWYSGSNTTATFEIRNLSTIASGNDFGIDDVYFGTCNLAPIANNDLRTTPRNTTITFSATANDTDGDGAVVPGTFLFANGATSVSVTGGTFSVDGSGNVTFAPTTGFTGTAVTTYTVKDNNPLAATSNPGTISVTVGPPPVDLATAIAASATTVNAGATETLTVTASNNGPAGTATNVTQTVQLPAGLTNVAFGTPTVGAGATLVAGSTPSYNSTTGLVTFPVIASQATGATGNVAYTVSFNAPANGPFTATANVTSADNSDTNPANNAASTTIAVNPRFDLVTTLNGPNTAVQGTLATYTVTSANNGPSIAPNAVQTVTGLPTGLTQAFVSNGGYYNATAATQTLYYVNGSFTTTNPGGGAAAYTLAAGGVIFPPVASFASSQALSNTISFVAPASGAAITPVATLTPNTNGAGETLVANNTAGLNGVPNGATTTTAPANADQANLSVATLTTSASSVAPGAAVTVNVTFKNNGPNTAAGVAYQLSLTPGTVITSPLPTGASYNSTTGIVTLNGIAATLASAGTQSYALTFTAPAVGPVLVAANVSSTQTTDPVPADNFASTKVEILPSANVGTSIAGPALALAGQSVNYAVTTTNSGAASAQNVVQTVALPGGLSVITLQLNGSTGTLSAGVITFTGGATYSVLTGMLTLPTIANAAAGSTTTNSITFVAPSGVASFSATAAVSSTTPDAVLANNSATATTTVTPSVDVRTLVSGPASVLVFSPMTLSVTTLNDGPSVAATVVPALQLPANLTNVVVPTGANYNSTSGLVTFASISNLASGAAVTNSVSFTMPDVAQVTALGTSAVSGGAVDRNVDNNRVSFTTTSATPTDQVADLSATVTSSVGPTGSVAAGSPVTLTLTIANGPTSTSDVAANIRPVLALPAGLNVTTLQVSGQTGNYNSGTGVVTFPSGATYNANTGQVIFPVVNTLLASDAAGYAALTYTVTLTAPGTGPLVATGSVASATSDPAPANNQQTLNVTVTSAADLVTNISGPASAPAAGGQVAYAITTTNNGATPAASATTTVVLPIPSGASYSVNGGAAQTYNGTGVTLPVVPSQQPGANGAVTNTISFTSPSGAPGTTFAVTATASTTTTETNPANNVSSATTTRANQVPVAQNVVNSLQAPEGNTAGQLRISPLAATDADGTVATYQLTGSLPASSQGVLYYNNNVDGTSGSFVALPIGQSLTPAQANTLRFDPATTYAGNVLFIYTATDNLGAVSAAALYTIPVATDVQFAYKTTPVKGGNANQYQNGNVLAYGIDPNGAAYNTAGLIYNLDGTTAIGTVNNGIRMGKISVADSTLLAGKGIRYTSSTGLFTVVDRTLLPRTGQAIPVSVTTVDLFGGITTQTVSLVLGQNPLPVELTAFTATAVKNVDASLAWTTASEKNNDHFEVERSLNGADFVKIGQVQGQGSTTSPTAYALLDTGIGPKANGVTVYYRLKQVDTDGTGTYSPVRTVSFIKGVALTPSIGVYPNPATTVTQLDLTQVPAGTYQVSVLDATGRVVLQTSRDAGFAQALDLRTVASGTYTVLVRGMSNGKAINLTKRLIKE
jgi:hypothetical protein